MPQDIMGNEISVNDIVVFGMAQHMHLLTGIVTAINPKTVKILYSSREHNGREWKTVVKDCNRAFEDVVVVNGL